jgi:hypothetical protein
MAKMLNAITCMHGVVFFDFNELAGTSWSHWQQWRHAGSMGSLSQDSAIKTLETAVDKFPTQWSLWD